MGSKEALWGVPLAALLAVVAIVAVQLQRDGRLPGETEARMPAGDVVEEPGEVARELAPAEIRPDTEARVGAEPEPVEECPSDGWIAGRVIVPPGASPEGLRLAACPAGMSSRGMLILLRGGLVMLGADGAFELGPLAAGETTVFAFPPGDSRLGGATSGGRPTGSVELGVVEVLAGVVTERDFTLLDVPGTIRVSVTSFGLPLGGAFVHLRSHDGGPDSLLLDGEGRTEPRALFPGPWSIYVVDRSRGWIYRHPRFAYVVAGRELEVDVSVQLVEGTLTVIDEARVEPLADRELALRMVREAGYGGPAVSGVLRRTDAAGRLALELIPGDYVLELEDRSAVLTWTAAGPAAAEVDL